jgi:hypothetical protein
MSSFDVGQLDEPYRDELQRLAERGGRQSN